MPKQPYAIAMKNGEPFALAGIWENWKRPGSEEWVRTFAIITTNSNELVSAIHDRMPVIIAPEDYTRWLSPLEPDPRDLGALSGGTHDDVADLNPREQARER